MSMLTKLNEPYTLLRGCCLLSSAALGLTLLACGEETAKKPTTQTPDTNPSVEDPNLPATGGTVPQEEQPAATDPNPNAPITGTNLVVTLDDVVREASTHAFYGAPTAQDSNEYVSILPYDYFAWVKEHAYDAVPKTAKGSGVRLNLTKMGVTKSSKFPLTYKVNKPAPGDGAVPFTYYNGSCVVSSRQAIEGSVTIVSWEGTGTSTVIKGKWSGIKLFDNQNAQGKKSSAADGTFETSTAVQPRASGFTPPTATQDPAACNPVNYN